MINRLKHAPWFALILATVHIIAGLSILLVSSWFIAASAIAGVGFNYMLPAVVIRALALIRISSGYAEMWFGHRHLLSSLAKLRLRLFSNMKNQRHASSALEADKLTYHTEAVASVWMGWVSQNAGVWLGVGGVYLITLYLLPLFSALWLSFMLLSLVIYGYLLLSSVSLSESIAEHRLGLEKLVEFKIHSADIWHLYQNNTLPTGDSFYQLSAKLQQFKTNAEAALLLISLLAVGYSIHVMEKDNYYAPLGLIIPMALLAAPDWLGRIFSTQPRLLDSLQGHQALTNDAQNIQLTREQNHLQHIELKDFIASGARHRPINLTLKKGDLILIEGGSGIGKSMLLKAISGLVEYQGCKYVDHQPLSANTVLDNVIYIEQQPYCLSASVRDNLLVADPSASDASIKQTLQQLYLTSLLNLDEWLGTNGRALSGGELKRLGLARAILSHTDVLLLDEPFEGLDQDNIRNVTSIINKLSENKIVLVASHLRPEGLAVTECERLG